MGCVKRVYSLALYKKIMLSCCIILLLYIVNIESSSVYIAGYEAASDVGEHKEIDLDIKKISTVLKSNGYNGCAYRDSSSACSNSLPAMGLAWLAYSNGTGESTKNSGYKYRNIKGFSTSSTTKVSNYVDGSITRNYGVAMADEPFYATTVEYWQLKGLLEPNGNLDWGDRILDAAFKNNSILNSFSDNLFNFADQGDDFRLEVIQKGAVYFNVMPYTIWEMQDALNDCRALKHSNLASTSQENSIKAWDEAVAFYTGSEEGDVEGGLRGCDSGHYGQLMFALAEKRAGNFQTCTGRTTSGSGGAFSQLNSDLFLLFTEGKEDINAAFAHSQTAYCDDAELVKLQIVKKMLIPIIQGTLRYLYKSRVGVTAGTDYDAKEQGELFAFTTAALPHIHKCSPKTAQLLYERTWGDVTPGIPTFDTDWETIKTGIESTYPCLGITCTDVGALTDAEYHGACVDQSSSTSKQEDKIPDFGIAIIAIFGIATFIGAALGYFYWKKYVGAYTMLNSEMSKTEILQEL